MTLCLKLYICRLLTSSLTSYPRLHEGSSAGVDCAICLLRYGPTLRETFYVRLVNEVPSRRFYLHPGIQLIKKGFFYHDQIKSLLPAIHRIAGDQYSRYIPKIPGRRLWSTKSYDGYQSNCGLVGFLRGKVCPTPRMPEQSKTY